ncbi:MAG: restriction endonuclease subunit S, partial [Candidatus Bipolaricaulis sp.]|nr:restriction endonuclease subunit S [Candidatus Bipolaricaulis sp.]
MRLDGRGPFLRETVSGAETAAKHLSRVAKGDFIYSRLFAWRGAFGVVPDALDSAYVSDEFPTFAVTPDCLDGDFLRYWFRLPSTLERVTADCSGSTPLTRNRFKENFFLALEIPLPPLTEQQRIVARIEELAALIDEARTLRQRSAEEATLLVSRATAMLLDDAGWEDQRLGELLVESPRNGLSPKPEVESGGRPMLRINAVSSSPTRFVDLTAAKQVDATDDEAEPFTLR